MPDTRKPPPPWLTQALYVATKLGIPGTLADGRFASTRVDQKLRSDAPGTMAPMIRFFDHLETDSEFAGVFTDAMTGVSSIALVEAFPA